MTKVSFRERLSVDDVIEIRRRYSSGIAESKCGMNTSVDSTRFVLQCIDWNGVILPPCQYPRVMPEWPRDDVECRYVLGFDDYTVDAEGGIWTKKRKRNNHKWHKIKPQIDKDNCASVNLYKDDKPYRKLVGSLVLHTFVGDPVDKDCICIHIDRDSLNNRLANLRYGKRTEIEVERTKGESHHTAVLTDVQVIEILHKAASGVIQSEIAKEYQISKSCVEKITSRKSWKHIDFQKPELTQSLNNNRRSQKGRIYQKNRELQSLDVTYVKIPGYGDMYEVGSDGSVWSLKFDKKQRLREGISKKGYLSVNLYSGSMSTKKCFKVHQLVLLAFVGPKPTESPHIRHLNDNPSDNRLENLAYGTAKDNCADRKRNGFDNSGSKSHLAKLIEEDVIEIVKLCKSGETYHKVAQTYKVSTDTISNIVNRKTWKNVPEYD